MNRCLKQVIAFCLLSLSTTIAADKLPPAISHLNFVDTGNPQGVPVVLIHAFPMNQVMWDEQVESLKKIARVITFDVRGFGKSKLEGPYTLEFIVDDLIGLLDHLKIQKAVVCGL